MTKNVTAYPKLILLVIILMLGIGLAGPGAQDLWAWQPDEAGLSRQARTILRRLGCAQYYYKKNGDEHKFCPPSCANGICWNSSSIVGSTDQLLTTLYQEKTTWPYIDKIKNSDYIANIYLALPPQYGDIRLRCRDDQVNDDNVIYCFAYRCKTPEEVSWWEESTGMGPSGCEQRWRIQMKTYWSGLQADPPTLSQDMKVFNMAGDSLAISSGTFSFSCGDYK